MTRATIDGLAGLRALIGQKLGPTDWRTITQADVDAFLPPYEPRQVLDPAEPVSIGAMVGPEAFTEVRYLAYERMRQALEVSILVSAPLLLTALGNDFFSTDLLRPIGALPIQIYRYAVSPYDDWHTKAWGASLVLVVVIGIIGLALRFVARQRVR